MRSTASSLVGTVVEKPVRLGAAGYVIGLQITPDAATQLCWTDAGGAYYRTGGPGSEWQFLNEVGRLPATAYDPRQNNGALTDGEGCYTAAFAPSRPQRIIMSWDATLYYSDNGGVTFVQMALPAKRMLANSNAARLFNRRSAFHPTDPNTYLVGTCGDGLYYSTNANLGATATFTKVNAVPNPITDPSAPVLVAFDPSNASNVVAFSWGNGAYRTTTGVTGTWARIGAAGAGPTGASGMRFASDGTLWVVDQGVEPRKLWKLAAGSSTWQEIYSASPMRTIGIDPNDPNILYPFGDNGELRRSTDGGATVVGPWFLAWPGPIGIFQNAGPIPHLGGINASIFPADVVVDQTGRVWCPQGLGVSYSTPPVGFARWDWTDDSLGIEELVPKRCLTIPGNPRVMFGVMDKGAMISTDVDRFVANPCFPNRQDRRQVDHGWDLDYAGSDPNYVVNLCNGFNQIAGHSFDGGATWSVFDAQHPSGHVEGGAVAVTNPGWIIWVPGDTSPAVWSKDYGKTWHPVVLPGGSQTGSTGWIYSIYHNRYCVKADKDQPGVAYLVSRAGMDVGAALWRTSNGGETWTKQFTGLIDPQGDPDQHYHCIIKPVLGHSGELLYTCGKDFVNGRLMRSLDSGVTWSGVRENEIREVRSFDFGKNYDGAAYPAVYLLARVNGVTGFYVTFDWFATTPRLLTRFPDKNVTHASSVFGDMNRIGRCYMGVDGRGFKYAEIVDTVSAT